MYVYQCLWRHCWLHWVHMRYIYWHSVPTCAHELIDICWLAVAFEGHICCWYMYVYTMENKSCSWWIFFFDLCVQQCAVTMYTILLGHMTRKSCCTLLWSSLPKEWNDTLHDTVGITYCDASINGIIWPKCHVACHSNCLYLRNAVVPLTTLVALYATNNNAIGVSGQKSDVEPHFNYLNVKNPLVTLMMLLACCDTDASASVIKWPRSHVLPHLNCLDQKNAMVPSTTPLGSQHYV